MTRLGELPAQRHVTLQFPHRFIELRRTVEGAYLTARREVSSRIRQHLRNLRDGRGRGVEQPLIGPRHVMRMVRVQSEQAGPEGCSLLLSERSNRSALDADRCPRNTSAPDSHTNAEFRRPENPMLSIRIQAADYRHRPLLS